MFTKPFILRLVSVVLVILFFTGGTLSVRAAAPRTRTHAALAIPAAGSLGVQFVHVVTAENIYPSASYGTILDHPLANGNPNAVIIVTQDDNPGHTGGVTDPHPIGLFYSFDGRWIIFNQDTAAMPLGAAFNVIIPAAGAGVFVQKAAAAGRTIDINNALANGHPKAMILVTPNLTPGGVPGGVDNFHIGLKYHGSKWAVFSQDGSLIPIHSAFNVFILPAGAGVFVQKATPGNTGRIIATAIDNPLTNDNPNALVFVTPSYNPGGTSRGMGDNHPTGVVYDGTRWEIDNQDLAAMPVGAAFNVLVLVPSSAVFVHAVTAANGGGTAPYTKIDNALTNGHPNALVFFTPNLTVSTSLVNHNLSAYYTAGQWSIMDQDAANLPAAALVNVLVPNPDASVFVHTASAANIVSESTILDYPLTNGNANAILLVTTNFNPGGVGGAYDDHPVGVKYDGTHWRIFNQNGVIMSPGATFNVLVITAAPQAFVHTATLGNIAYSTTEISNPLIDGNPNAILIVTPNWNPGGVGGTVDSHPVGVYYTGGKWLIVNQDAAGMPDGAAFNVYALNPPVTFLSAGAQDGWVLESSETSNKGGTLNARTGTFNLGDDASNRQYRAILHFDTSSLPDTAVITRATLMIRKQGLAGTNPFNTHGALSAYLGSPSFGAAALQVSDFQSAPASPLVAGFSAIPDGGWYSATLSSLGDTLINLTGTTQFRLRFTKDDNNDHGADYMKFFSGNAPAANQPMLVIEYYVP